MSLHRLDVIDRHMGKLEAQLERRLGKIDTQLADHHQHLLQILTNQETIMTKVSDFATKQSGVNERIEKAIDGIVLDVKNLNDEILQLQNSAGNITAEDQALLDGIQTKAEALAKRLEDLDAQNPAPAPTP